MKRDNDNIILKAFAAYAFAIAFPLIAKYVFRSNIHIALVIGLAVVKPTLALIGNVFGGNVRRGFITASSIFSIAYLVIITIGILITPASAYRILFKSIQTNFLNPGRVSNLFVLFIGYFAAAFSTLFIERDATGPFAGIMLIVSVIAAMVFQSPLVYIPLIVFIVFALAYNAFTSLDGHYRVRAIILSVIIIALGAGAGYGMYNAFNIYGSREIDELSAALQTTVSRVFPAVPIMYELPEFGFSFDDDFKRPLGSTPILSEVPILAVDAGPGERVIYIRTRVHRLLTERQVWETLELDTIRSDNKIRAYKGEPNVTIKTPEFVIIEKRPRQPDEIAVTVLGEYFTNLPMTLDAPYIRLEGGEPVFSFGSRESGLYFDSDHPLLHGDTVYIARGARKLSPLSDKAPYLQIPAFISSKLRDLARVYAGDGDPKSTAFNIRDDLEKRCAYSLNTDDTSHNDNFIERFLFTTKSGYCTHFASSLIMIARLCGIPARYATGFLAIIPQPDIGSQSRFDGYKTVLTGLSAHVWPEIWIPGEGWTIVEATPAVNIERYTLTDDGLVYTGKERFNEYTKRQLQAMFGERVAVERAQVREAPVFHISIDPIIIAYIAGPLLFIVLIFRYFYIIRYIFAKNRKTVTYLGRKIVRKHLKHFLPAPSETGWVQWANGLAKISRSGREPIDNFLRAMIRVAYSGDKVRKEDVRTVFRFYRKVKSVRIKPPVKSSRFKPTDERSVA